MPNTTPTKILYWVRTPHDSRDTASSTGYAIVPQHYALTLARGIHTWGQAALRDAHRLGYLIEFDSGHPLHEAASGHYVTILYASGRTRTIRS